MLVSPFYIRRRLLSLALGGALLSGALAGCQPQPDLVLEEGFELAPGEVPTEELTTEQVRSGQYALKFASAQEFAGTRVLRLGDKLPYSPRTLRLSAWVYFPDGRIRSSILVMQVLRHGQGEDVWAGFHLDAVVKRYGKWEYAQTTIDLPDGLSPDDELKYYLWHAEGGGTAFYLDDLRIEAWP